MDCMATFPWTGWQKSVEYATEEGFKDGHDPVGVFGQIDGIDIRARCATRAHLEFRALEAEVPVMGGRPVLIEIVGLPHLANIALADRDMQQDF